MSVNILESMIGVKLSAIELDGLPVTHKPKPKGAFTMTFLAADGRAFAFEHRQDCCEIVSIEDVVGDLDDLVGSPLLIAEEVSSENEPPPESGDSYTWTFYRFATVKGTVTVRWLGESNGYYSESVDLRLSTWCGHADCAEEPKLREACKKALTPRR